MKINVLKNGVAITRNMTSKEEKAFLQSEKESQQDAKLRKEELLQQIQELQDEYNSLNK